MLIVSRDPLERAPALRNTTSHILRRSSEDDRVLRYAPLLRFSRHETHFPIDPSLFVRRARLRRLGWSDDVRDAVWHPRRGCWETALAGLPPSADAVGPDVGEACRLIQFEARSASPGLNRRPCDPRNIWYGRRAGYALELGDALARDLRGVPGAAPFLLFDRYTLRAAGEAFDVISYWFFYALHPDAYAHEGDWQHVSVLVPQDGAELPRVRFESPAGGVTCGFDSVEITDGTHPVAWVEPGSHATFRCAEDLDSGPRSANTILLKTWELEAKRIPTLSWSNFDGAWGRVGGGPRTTGPLGPLFRREEEGAAEGQAH